MSYRATAWAYDLNLRGSRKFVLVALADMADEAGSCFPGQERLVEMTGLSVRTVRRALEQLEDEALIVREARHDPRGYRTSDRYYLQLTAVRLPANVTAAQISPGPVDNPPTGQSDRRSSTTRLPANLSTPTGHGDRATNHQGNHQENHQGATPGPTCGEHPFGTDKPCRACGDARRIWDASKQRAVEQPKPVRHIDGLCDQHRQREGECEACEQDARSAARAS